MSRTPVPDSRKQASHPSQIQRSTAAILPGQKPSRGALEAKPFETKLDRLAASAQVLRYLNHYNQVLITNLSEFRLLIPLRWRSRTSKRYVWTYTLGGYEVLTEVPDPSLTSAASGSADDLETSIDTLPPVSGSTSSGSALTQAFTSAGLNAVMTYSSASLPATPDGLWIPIHSAVVLRAASTWNPQTLESALQQSLRGTLTASTLGIDFHPNHCRPHPLRTHRPQTAHLRPYLFAQALPALGRPRSAARIVATARATNTPGVGPAVYVAGFDHNSQRAPHARLTGLIDGYRRARNDQLPFTPDDPAAPAGSPPFFSTHLRSLSDSFASLAGEHITERRDGLVVRQTVLYPWQTPIPSVTALLNMAVNFRLSPTSKINPNATIHRIRTASYRWEEDMSEIVVSSSAGHERTHLLVVEDEPTIRQLFCTLLSASGYSVAEAQDGFSALEEIRRQRPALILSDLNMPRMTGFELLSVIRRRFPAIHVIAMSGAFVGDQVPDGVAAEAFYQKSGRHIGTLVKVIEQILKGTVNLHAAAGRSQQDEPASGVALWVSQRGASIDGPHILLTCLECLRSFAHRIDKESSMHVEKTNCIFCRASISYALLDPSLVQHPGFAPSLR